MGNSGNSGKIDHDAVLRARVLLLGSGRLSLWQEVTAYRVLAEVSPRAYLPKLAHALVVQGYRLRDPESALALFREAAAAARRLDAGDPKRAELLRNALSACARHLPAAGRRDEGRAVYEELASEGAYGPLATVLAEEGRHAEAAALYDRHLGSGGEDASDWTLIEWAAALDAAGRGERALEVFAGLVADERSRAAADRSPLAALVWQLHHYAGMLVAAGREDGAADARREALVLLDRLAAGGEPVSWSNIQATWVTLFALSGRPDEPAATPDAPLPALGCYAGHGWSLDTRAAWSASVPALERRVADLSAAGDLPGLVAVHRRLTVRRAVAWETSGRRAEEELLPEFDEGVALARRLPGTPSAAARALADRAMFLLAVKRYEEARRDFAEAVELLDGPASGGRVSEEPASDAPASDMPESHGLVSGGPVSPISHPTSPK
ncbi:hypothetical protein GCM10019017_15050 [Streptomyces showdoensis]